MTVLLTIAVLLIAYSVVSAPLDRWGVTSAIVFVSAGFVVGSHGIGWLDIPIQNAVAERITELALALLLFSDASRLNLRTLRSHLAWPSRLLLIGLPLTMALGFLAALLILPGVGWASAFLLTTMLCSTDAALGQRVVEDQKVPARVRQALDVESGLNDGLAVPFFLVALDICMAHLHSSVPSAVVSNAASQIGWGLFAGIGAGALGGWALRLSIGRGWLQPSWQQICTLAIALCGYAGAVKLGGSGFIAAFVAGLAFGRTSREQGVRVTYLTEEAGNFLAAVTWMGFGALAIDRVLPDITWRVLLYAAVSLTVARMLPVAIALARTGARGPTIAFMGWFGPRGLASVVFGLLALEDGVPDANELLAVVVVTVGFSVFLHGLTSVPLVARYHQWYLAEDTEADEAEDKPTRVPRRRGQLGSLLSTPIAEAPAAPHV